VKKKLLIVFGSVVILASVLAVTVYAMQRPQTAQVDVLPLQQLATDEAERAPAQVQAARAIVAEGVVAPLHHATLSMAAGGIVAEVLVQEGDLVQQGQVILRLRDAHQRAAVARAEAALAGARAGLAALEAGPRPQEIAAVQASLDAAEARLARLNEGSRPEEIAAGQAGLEAAQAALERLYDGPGEFTRVAAQADLSNAEAALRQAQAAYDKVAGSVDIQMMPQSLQLELATNQYNAAKARYEALFAEPDAHLVASARAQVRQAEANLERLERPVTATEIAEAAAMMRSARAQLDLLQAGAREEEVAAARATVAEAEAALQAAQAGLADTELRAPSAATLAALQVSEGEQVLPGHPLAEVADLTTWRIETDDLTELDVLNVQEGDRVLLTFDAIPGLEMQGTVLRIKPIGQEKLGDITYTVIVQPDEQDSRLRWNMTAVVTVP